MRGVFISYRQDDAKPWALLLGQDLVQAFGPECVFLVSVRRTASLTHGR